MRFVFPPGSAPSSLHGALRRTLIACVACAGLIGCSGCDEGNGGEAPASSNSSGPLPPELASKVLAKVGDREITLGEYAATLERMDQFERLRYQSPDRRKQLLDEMIQVELLAQEAERRGLDKRPETQERVRIILRNEVLKKLRRDVPGPESVSEADARKYYEKHRDDFREPERRRVAVIVLGDAGKAKTLLPQALKATPMQWGKLVMENSLEKPPNPSPTAPLELAGDLGIVSAPGVERGANQRVPNAVREAVFKIAKVGEVSDGVVEDSGRFYIVRLIGKTDARDRPFKEAERSIRVSLVQEHIRAAEEKLEKELREKYPVKIDEKALEKVKLPSEQSAAPAPSAAASAAVAPSSSAGN
ncbi:MAG: peptidyl-prolyl cis-trans isomerase [Polyangiaceae bacterium]|nr:peptidyl-prolyl cis-trans isomerase [Myxococcales bacterium]MCB9585175.1 peptidyl-prolyl cis-trans isomerase [Polyangiaceae bacterium]